jgi:hypothetical protein
MRRKKKRRPVHYITFGFPDGAAVACSPARKPSGRKIKDEGISIDVDCVIRDYRYSSKSFECADVSQRVRMSDLLSNRLNMRRTVRELVLPCLANIVATLRSIEERLERIEASSEHKAA